MIRVQDAGMTIYAHCHNCAACERELWYEVFIVGPDPSAGLPACADDISGPERCECGFVFDLDVISEDALLEWKQQGPEWEPEIETR